MGVDEEDRPDVSIPKWLDGPDATDGEEANRDVKSIIKVALDGALWFHEEQTAQPSGALGTPWRVPVMTDDEVAAFKARWRERRHGPAQVLHPVNAGPVERLGIEVQELRGRVELLRARADIADAAIRGLRRSMRLVIAAGAMLAVAVVILAAVR